VRLIAFFSSKLVQDECLELSWCHGHGRNEKV
jgi:hypothetical protein